MISSLLPPAEQAIRPTRFGDRVALAIHTWKAEVDRLPPEIADRCLEAYHGCRTPAPFIFFGFRRQQRSIKSLHEPG